jgi:hypothetical protein
LPLFFSCEKPEVLSPDIYGTWSIEKVRLLGDEMDSSVTVPGTFIFRKSPKSYNAGGTVYGEELSCLADFPVNKGSKSSSTFSTVNREIFFTKAIDPSNYNYKSFYSGLYGYIDPIDNLNHYGSIMISFRSPTEIIVSVGNGNISTNSIYSIFHIHLKKK